MFYWYKKSSQRTGKKVPTDYKKVGTTTAIHIDFTGKEETIEVEIYEPTSESWRNRWKERR